MDVSNELSKLPGLNIYTLSDLQLGAAHGCSWDLRFVAGTGLYDVQPYARPRSRETRNNYGAVESAVGDFGQAQFEIIAATREYVEENASRGIQEVIHLPPSQVSSTRGISYACR